MSTAETVLGPNEPAWDEAFLRVESYLRALHVESRVLLNGLTTDIIAEAKRVVTEQGHPVSLAMQVAQTRLDAWFARMTGSTAIADDKFRARGRLALVMADRQGEWAHYFASGETPPEPVVAAMKQAALQAGPEVRFSNMPPAPLEFQSQQGQQPPQPGMRSVFLRAAGVWVSIIGLMGVAWAASH